MTSYDTFGPLPKRQQDSFRATLLERYGELPEYITKSELWSPYVVSENEYDEVVRIQQALQVGLVALLAAAPTDPRLIKLLAPRLNEEMLESFKPFQSSSHDNQFIRPDYIYNDGKPQVCEINTRFIFNGNIFATDMAERVSNRQDLDMSNYRSMSSYMHRTYDGDGDTVFVSNSELHNDLLLQMQNSGTTQSLKPENLKFLDPQKVGRLIIELHQHELEEAVDDIAAFEAAGVPIYNNPLVVQILHDKRLLVALSDESYMKELVDAETAQVLAEGVIPSYHPQWHGRELERMPGKIALAKGAISGKSEDQIMILTYNYEGKMSDPNMYVYQKRHLQPRIIASDGTPVEVSGTLPMTLTGEVFGPGIVRVLPHNRLRHFKGMSIAARQAS